MLSRNRPDTRLWSDQRPARSECPADAVAHDTTHETRRDGAVAVGREIGFDLRLQYELRMPSSQVVGFYWEIYNAFDRVNFGNPVGDRSSTFFMQSVNADLPRTMQLGLRYTF